MPNRPSSSRNLADYAALSQVGLEMVGPVAVGALLDYYLGWAPWGTIVGAILGLVGGMAHLLAILNHPRDDDRTKKPNESA